MRRWDTEPGVPDGKLCSRATICRDDGDRSTGRGGLDGVDVQTTTVVFLGSSPDHRETEPISGMARDRKQGRKPCRS